jgi:hypothetical protein
MATAVDVMSVTENPKEQTDMTADEVIAKIDELVNLANFLKRVAKPMVRRYSKKRAKVDGGSSSTRRNGFAVPVTMEAKMVSFLNAHAGTEYTLETVIARTDVTSAITQYIKSKNLQIPENRKNFTMDAALSTVFGVDEGSISNWFEIQKHLTKVITSVSKKRKDEVVTDVADECAKQEPANVSEVEASSARSTGVSKRIKRGA